LVPYSRNLTECLQIRFQNPENRRFWAAMVCSVIIIIAAAAAAAAAVVE
jgi:hypothetical protein